MIPIACRQAPQGPLKRSIMAALFVSIFWLAKPIMDGIQTGINWLGAVLTTKLADGQYYAGRMITCQCAVAGIIPCAIPS